MAVSFQRILPLEGGCNLRDLGGYRTSDGRRIRQGVLFRSGVMSYFTPNDHAQLSALKVRTICDLRRADERAMEPTRWPTATPMIYWGEEQPRVKRAKREALPANSTAGDRTRAGMVDFYRTMPCWLQTQLRDILRRLAGGETPLLFHCSAGKDRTGFSAAIVLHLLGAPRSTIFDDYELTNTAVDLKAFMLKHQRATLGLTDEKHPLESLPADVLNALLFVDRAYLSAAFAEIEKDHNSIDGYVRNILGIGDDVIQQLRNALLID